MNRFGWGYYYGYMDQPGIYYNQENQFNRPYKNQQTGEFFDGSYYKYYSNLAGDVFNGNMGLAGLKRSNLEGGIQVPLVFY